MNCYRENIKKKSLDNLDRGNKDMEQIEYWAYIYFFFLNIAHFVPQHISFSVLPSIHSLVPNIGHKSDSLIDDFIWDMISDLTDK